MERRGERRSAETIGRRLAEAPLTRAPNNAMRNHSSCRAVRLPPNEIQHVGHSTTTSGVAETPFSRIALYDT